LVVPNAPASDANHPASAIPRHANSTDPAADTPARAAPTASGRRPRSEGAATAEVPRGRL